MASISKNRVMYLFNGFLSNHSMSVGWPRCSSKTDVRLCLKLLNTYFAVVIDGEEKLPAKLKIYECIFSNLTFSRENVHTRLIIFK